MENTNQTASKSSFLIITIIVVAIVVIGLIGFAFYTNFTKPQTLPTAETLTEKEVAVSIEDYKFSPANIVISKGTKVTWTNKDSSMHTATASGKFDSGDLDMGESYSFTFEEAGTFDYICTPHPYMVGKITVQ